MGQQLPSNVRVFFPQSRRHDGLGLNFDRLTDYGAWPITATVRSPPGLIDRWSAQPLGERPRKSMREYMAGRLTFRRDVIEQLGEDDSFRIVSPQGTFQMTKSAFYRAFPRVVQSRSYREAGIYHYPQVPKAAEPFRVHE